MLIPHGRNEDEGGRDGGFEAAEQDTQGNQSGPILCGRDQRRDKPPECDISAEIFGSWKALHQVASRQFEGEIGYVEDEGELGELIAGYWRRCEQLFERGPTILRTVCVLFQAHHSSVVD